MQLSEMEFLKGHIMQLSEMEFLTRTHNAFINALCVLVRNSFSDNFSQSNVYTCLHC